MENKFLEREIILTNIKKPAHMFKILKDGSCVQIETGEPSAYLDSRDMSIMDSKDSMLYIREKYGSIVGFVRMVDNTPYIPNHLSRRMIIGVVSENK